MMMCILLRGSLMFPAPDAQPIEMPEPVSMGNVEIPEAAEISGIWMKYLGIAGGVLAFALLLFILYKLRKTKTASLKLQVKTQASARGGIDLKEMIGRILKGIRQALHPCQFFLCIMGVLIPGTVAEIFH